MQRFFVKNLLFVLSVNILVKPVWIFMIDRTVQNRVGHESYGLYQALFNMGIIFQIILDFGLSNYNTRIISQDPDKIKDIFPSMFSARMLMVFAYAILVGLLALLLGYDKNELILLSGILLIQAFAATLLFIRSNVSSLHRFKADSLLSVTDRLLMIVLCGFLLFNKSTAAYFTIEWFVAAQIICYFIAIIIAMVVLKKITRLQFRFSFDAAKTFEIIRQSAPYALLIFLMSVYTRVDSVLLERLLGESGKEEAGIYAAGYRLLDVCNIFGLMFAGILLPLFGRMLVQKQNIGPIIGVSVNILIPFSFMIAVAAWFFGDEIMHMLYNDSTEQSALVFALLMSSFPAFCIMYVYSTLLTASGNLKLLNKIAVAGVVVNIALNIFLIPIYRSAGAATAALVTQTTLALCFIIFAKKDMRLSTNIKWVIAHLSFLLLLFISAYTVRQASLHWYIQLSLFAAICLPAVFLFRFVSIASIKKLMARG
jgi:O-antigen/teichoic acid export membrane protein